MKCCFVTYRPLINSGIVLACMDDAIILEVEETMEIAIGRLNIVLDNIECGLEINF